MRVCSYCKLAISENCYYSSDWKSGGHICKKCRNSQYKINIGDKEKLYTKLKSIRIKAEVLNNYGSVCECCGENCWQFLTIDHVDLSGAEHRRSTGRHGGRSMYHWLKKNNYPKENFRILCMNCNACNGFHGFCSHKYKNKHTTNCMKCEKLIYDDIFDLHKENGNMLCKACVLDLSRKYVEDNGVKRRYKTLYQVRKDQKSVNLRRRQKLIHGYGGKCACCGQDDLLFLTIDHIQNDGAFERKEIFKNNTVSMYRNIIECNFPEKYQLLCYNCNTCKGFYGQCYHSLIKNAGINSISILDYEVIIRDNYRDKYIKGIK